ncbi:glycosyltransferase family 2 protein (plasmid) [Tundrisphaera sp. TA3]|uniref:glycosyltransferase family 2 protein n=1 Tax=Tundrisphaera sp. TA3 TaxID=3435775 RepID=UPI003EB7621A
MRAEVTGVVAIGRNEGDRLRGCLDSLAGRLLPIVYVDSGSTDGSVALARSAGVEVVELDMSRPFSAARARNAGFERLREIEPRLGSVMFLDGDCEVVPGWLDLARAEMDARPRAAVVCGRRREKYPERSVYNRLADLEWETPIGEALACGGDALMRAEAFEAVGGFDPTAAAGEEPELCQRLRAAGWSVWRIDAEMTLHDLGMTRFRQWWRRMYRGGYNGLDIQTRFPGGDQPFARELKRSRLWAIHVPIMILAGSTIAGYLVGPSAAAAVALVSSAIYPARAARLALKIRPRVEGWYTALAYGALMIVGQFANAAGQLGYRIDRRSGRTGRLIEYKRVAEAVRPAATTLSS